MNRKVKVKDLKPGDVVLEGTAKQQLRGRVLEAPTVTPAGTRGFGSRGGKYELVRSGQYLTVATTAGRFAASGDMFVTINVDPEW